MQAHEPGTLIFVARFLIQNLQDLCIYHQCGQSVRAWWNNLRMAKINAATSMLFGFISFVLKLLGISNIVFEVTQKESDDSSDAADDNKDNEAANAGRFTFDDSPLFVPAMTLLFVQFTALGFSLLDRTGLGLGFGEYLSSVWVVMCFWPFVRGVFGKGKYGIPLSTLLKSASFAFIFVHLCM